MSATGPKLLHALLMGLAGGAMAAGWMMRTAQPPVLPIAILDRGALLKDFEAHSGGDDQIARVTQFESVARHLADAGYLVIDRGWVIAAPEDFYVDYAIPAPR